MEIRKNFNHKNFYRQRHYTQKEMKLMMLYFILFDLNVTDSRRQNDRLLRRDVKRTAEIEYEAER